MLNRKSSAPNLTVIAGGEPAKPEDRASTFATRVEEPQHHETEDASPLGSMEASKHGSLDGTVIAEVRTSA